MSARASRRLDAVGTLGLAGCLAMGAALVYVATTAAGSLLDPSYSQVRQHVSDLTATGASTWAPLAPLYLLHNALAVAFAIELYRASPGDRLWKLGTGLLVVNAFAGVMMVTLYREDIGGVPTTSAGAGHLVFAGLSSLVIVVAGFVYGVAFRRSAWLRPLAEFSFAVGVGFAILGPLAAVATAQKSDLAGLAERGPIGLFVLWLLVVGWYSLVVARRAYTVNDGARVSAHRPREAPR
jgi:Protein of unknown function (DUF998)